MVIAFIVIGIILMLQLNGIKKQLLTLTRLLAVDMDMRHEARRKELLEKVQDIMGA